jgi:hypothetical protein
MAYLTNDVLQDAVRDYQEEPTATRSRNLLFIFLALANDILEFSKFTNLELTPRRLAYEAMERAGNYNKKKGKAFNYFTTCMLNFMRKEYRRQRAERELEKKYAEYMK